MRGDTGTSMGGSIERRPKMRRCRQCEYSGKYEKKGNMIERVFCNRWKKMVSNKPDFHKCFRKREGMPQAGPVTISNLSELSEEDRAQMLARLFPE